MINSSPKQEITIAIESAIQGGSISLLRNETEIGNWIGTSSVSRAEDMLPNIQKLLESNNIDTTEVDFLAVSTGPGSYTGIRIGLSTALGLKNALNVRCHGVTALDAMRFSAREPDELTAAVPMGRNMICLQKFSINAKHAPELFNENAFKESLHAQKVTALIIHGSLYERFHDFLGAMENSSKIISVGYNLAGLIGSACRSDLGSDDLTPLFL